MTRQVEVRIRPATAEDAPFVARVIHRIESSGAPPWAAESADAEPDDGWVEPALTSAGSDTLFIVAEVAGDGFDGWAPAGALAALHVVDVSGERHPHISAVAVDEAAEGHGVGSALIRAAETWARESGAPYLTLHVYVGNESAQRLYRRLGFEDEWLRMRRSLAAPD